MKTQTLTSISLVVGLILAGGPALAAQPAASAVFPTPVRDSLLGALPDSLTARGAAVLDEPNGPRRLDAAARLSSAPGALEFTVRLAERDPSPAVRGQIVRAMRTRAIAVASSAGAMAALERIATTDPQVDISLDAIETIRVVRMTSAAALIPTRLAAARSGGDTAGVRRLLEEEERWISLRGGKMLPAFLRRVPPIFAAKPDSARRIRVLAFGDYGVGDSAQRRTAAAARAYHRQRPFDFGITLGDNFYTIGMLSTDDPRWKTQFEDLYAPMGIRFYATLGNHDWAHPDSPAAEILYSRQSRTWRMPAPYYTFTAGPVQFFAIDTQEMSEAQLLWLDRAIASSTATWKVVYGHFHMFSATRRDNATLIRRLKPLLDGRVDVYLCGHDHNLQALEPDAGVHYFVAGGGGASMYEMDSTYTRAIARFRTHGFAVLDADRTGLTVRLVDKDRKELYVKTLRK
jgi:hypothetical protein